MIQSLSFSYVPCKLGDIKAHTKTDEKGKTKVTSLEFADQRVTPTGRFWQSLYSIYGFNKAFFRFYTHDEVFQRIAKVNPNDKLRLCVEHMTKDSGAKTDRMLSASKPTKPVVHYDDMVGILEKYADSEAMNVDTPRRLRRVNTDRGNDIGSCFQYHDGVISSVHNPSFSPDWVAGGDTFSSKFFLDTPIDGYGQPNIYLSALRHVCTNHVVMRSKLFKSQVALGKGEDDYTYPIQRLLEGYNNEDGFLAIQQRIETAQHSWASINETQKLYKTLMRIHAGGFVDSIAARGRLGQNDKSADMDLPPVMEKFNSLIDGVNRVYGIANMDALTVKKQRTLPGPVKVYDLVNFASEVATHCVHANTGGASAINTYVGELLADEFDLEGSCEKFTDWRDFLVLDEAAIATKAELDSLSLN